MEQVCPLCNGLTVIYELCCECGKTMSEEGKMEDYKGPYSPYMDRESFTYNNDAGMVTGDHLCVHLYYCEDCKVWKCRAVQPKFF